MAGASSPGEGVMAIRFLATVAFLSALLLGWPGSAAAAPGTEPDSISATTPRFSRHVSAVLSRLGCNGGTCHGAVKGQNGFRLTLFAADPALDHERLLREAAGRRLNRDDPDRSLLLLKATAQVSHQGGKRLDAASPEYADLAPLDRGRRGP